MGQQIAVSFEDEWVKIVYGSTRKGTVAVYRTLTLKETELDQWLASEKSREFIVVCRFPAFYSDITALPPAKDKYLAKMVEAEIRKKYPEAKDVSFFFSVLGTRESGFKQVKEVFYYAVDNVILHGIVARFERFHKRISVLCPDVLALTHLVRTSDQTSAKTVLCISLTEGSKTLFLLKNGDLRFLRVIPSMGRDIHQVDVDNINMTIGYCRQALRVEPQQILLVGLPETDMETPHGAVVPIAPVKYPGIVGCTAATAAECISPIAAILAAPRMKSSSLLPADIRSGYRMRYLLASGILLFLVGTLIATGYLALSLGEFVYARNKIRSVRSEIPGLSTLLADYQARLGRMQELASYVAAVNELQSTPGIQGALAELRFLPMPGINIQNLQITTDADALKMRLDGQVRFRSLAELHANYQKLLTTFKSIATMTIVSESLNIRDGKFSVDIQYRKS
ncbi:MAG TPA: hypothetical protein DEO88_06850 [Syntrophobacteraceae bacterium]|nr:hypothetical protein [Syntrophobacteraceae bacterium]